MRVNKVSWVGGVLAGTLLVLSVVLALHYTLATQSLQAELVKNAAQLLAQEILAKAFDERTATGPVFGEQWLTPPAELGPDYDRERILLPDTLSAGLFASQRMFNDIDDYDGYARRIVTASGDTILLSVQISYLTPSGTVADEQTLAKGIRITVVYGDAERNPERFLVVNY